MQTDGHDFPWLIEACVPHTATLGADVKTAFEDAVGEPVLAEARASSEGHFGCNPTSIARRLFDAAADLIRGFGLRSMASQRLCFDIEEPKEGGKAICDKRTPAFRKFTK